MTLFFYGLIFSPVRVWFCWFVPL